MGFGKEGEFDFGGCVIGAFLYESYDIKAPRVLKKRDGKFWTLYGSYAQQGSYEIDLDTRGGKQRRWYCMETGQDFASCR